MVKHLTRGIKLMILSALLMIICGVIWLHSAKHTLNWLKPWIEDAVNTPDAPYEVRIGTISIDWQDATKLGQLEIANIDIAKRNGPLFVQIPEIFVTVDPLGFLPERRMLHLVMIHNPKLYMNRNAAGTIQLGLENSKSPLPLAALFSSVANDAGASSAPGKLPFHELRIDNANLAFSDESTGTNITSTEFAMSLKRDEGRYDAALSMPFTFDDDKGVIDASLRTSSGGEEHLLNIGMKQVPAKLLCVFGLCPDRVEGSGPVDGKIVLRVSDDGTLQGVRAAITTKKAKLTAPDWFEKPVILGNSIITAESDLATHTITLKEMKLKLEDTTVTGKGTAKHNELGWYIDLEGGSETLDIQKLYKYWPLFMAPESRKWITSKLKSGRAENGKLRLRLTPEDIAAENFSDGAVDASAQARDITFEYLPGFPLIEHMDGLAKFTGNTVKVEGGGGTLLTGTKITKAMLWCGELNNHKIPMEANVTLTAPATDAATLLALEHFKFDDTAKLDPTKITGAVDANMVLKFNAFSGNSNTDPNAVNFDSVFYDIDATLKDVAQEQLFGSYNAQAMNGQLKANNNTTEFNGSLRLGDAPAADITLTQPNSKPLTLTVKTREPKPTAPGNDFTLVYKPGKEAPSIDVKGERLDISASYGTSATGSGSSLLKNFPAMNLSIDLASLVMDSSAAFTQVKGNLFCDRLRCETASFMANTGKGKVKASITHPQGMRQLLLTASNAGDFLKALGVSDRMIGGTFEFKGNYRDGQRSSPLDARLMIQDFTLKNSEILGRILSIGSLTGMLNALTGSGISFDKMAANVDARAGVITVSKGRANGTALGITVEGVVDANAKKLAMKGVVVPAYALNSIIGKIPIIGMIAGGEGEGLIAFNYAVKGTFAKPDVSVNPLSGLTPGFLRGIFDFSDKEEIDHNAPEPESAEEEK